MGVFEATIHVNDKPVGQIVTPGRHGMAKLAPLRSRRGLLLELDQRANRKTCLDDVSLFAAISGFCLIMSRIVALPLASFVSARGIAG